MADNVTAMADDLTSALQTLPNNSSQLLEVMKGIGKRCGDCVTKDEFHNFTKQATDAIARLDKFIASQKLDNWATFVKYAGQATVMLALISAIVGVPLYILRESKWVKGMLRYAGLVKGDKPGDEEEAKKLAEKAKGSPLEQAALLVTTGIAEAKGNTKEIKRLTKIWKELLKQQDPQEEAKEAKKEKAEGKKSGEDNRSTKTSSSGSASEAESTKSRWRERIKLGKLPKGLKKSKKDEKARGSGSESDHAVTTSSGTAEGASTGLSKGGSRKPNRRNTGNNSASAGKHVGAAEASGATLDE